MANRYTQLKKQTLWLHHILHSIPDVGPNIWPLENHIACCHLAFHVIPTRENQHCWEGFEAKVCCKDRGVRISSTEKWAIQRTAVKPSPWATLNSVLSGAHHTWSVFESTNICWESGVPLEPITLKEYTSQYKSHWRNNCKFSHGFCVLYLILSSEYSQMPAFPCIHREQDSHCPIQRRIKSRGGLELWAVRGNHLYLKLPKRVNTLISKSTSTQS